MATMKIYAMLSIADICNQPDNNLVAWWFEKPSIDKILWAIGGTYEDDAAVLAAAHIYNGGVHGFRNTEYRVAKIDEGIILPH